MWIYGWKRPPANNFWAMIGFNDRSAFRADNLLQNITSLMITFEQSFRTIVLEWLNQWPVEASCQ